MAALGSAFLHRVLSVTTQHLTEFWKHLESPCLGSVMYQGLVNLSSAFLPQAQHTFPSLSIWDCPKEIPSAQGTVTKMAAL